MSDSQNNSPVAHVCLNCQKSTKNPSVTSMQLAATVASDCRPQPHSACVWQCPSCSQIQKWVDDSYQQQVAEIYQSYAANPLTQGAEQLNYSSDVPLPRCQQILKNAEPLFAEWEHDNIKMLDVGTGSGVMLDAIHQHYPAWQLYAHDVSDHQAQTLKNKLPLQGFIAGEIDAQIGEQYTKRFQLLSLIHVLEHVLTPQAFLQNLAKMLSDDGILLIQVPNILENPWDLGIYDHVQHFSESTLIQLLSQVFPFVQQLASPIQKEITLVASKQRVLSVPIAEQREPTYPSPLQNISEELQRLHEQLSQASTCVLLGTGPAAGLLISSAKQWKCDHKIVAIIDEDSRKWGSEFGGIPVVSPQQKNKDAELLLPYPAAQRRQIAQRLKQVLLGS